MSNAATGRLAGLSYTALVLTGLFGIAYVPRKLITLSDPDATYAAIEASEALFRAGVAAEIVCYLLFPVLVAFLYRLFEPYGRSLALLMLLFVIASVPISMVAMAHKDTVIDIVSGAGSFTALVAEERPSTAIAQLQAYSNNLAMAQIFWGLWLAPLGLLILKTGLIPRLLGALLVIGCFGYLAGYFGPLFVDGYKDSMIAEIIDKPGAIGEIGTALWLLVFGARERSAG